MPPPTDRNLTLLPSKTVKPPALGQARHFTMLDQVTQLVAAHRAVAIAPRVGLDDAPRATKKEAKPKK